MVPSDTNNSIFAFKEFKELLFNISNFIQYYSFVCTQLKCFQVLLCNTNNLSHLFAYC